MVNPPSRGNFFIGNGVIVNDKFSATGEIIIDSQMSREITADKISFGKTGMLTASAVSAPGEAIIDGEMSGDITAEKITVGKTGKLTANAAASFIDVAGEVTQKTIATVSLSIKSGGVVSGEVSYGDLEIMRGGEIMGTITQIPK
jgi:hypothetical protein